MTVRSSALLFVAGLALCVAALGACDSSTDQVGSALDGDRLRLRFGADGEENEPRSAEVFGPLLVEVQRLGGGEGQPRFDVDQTALPPDWIVSEPERLPDLEAGRAENGATLFWERYLFVLTPTRVGLESLPDVLVGDLREPGPAIEVREAEPIDVVAERPADRIEPESSFWSPIWRGSVIGAVSGGVVVFLLGRRRRGPKKDRRTPSQRAVEDLRAAESTAEIHRALRGFLHEEYGLAAIGCTTDELLGLLEEDARFEGWDRARLAELLRACDLATFAGQEPGVESRGSLSEEAMVFCKPVDLRRATP